MKMNNPLNKSESNLIKDIGLALASAAVMGAVLLVKCLTKKDDPDEESDMKD